MDYCTNGVHTRFYVCNKPSNIDLEEYEILNTEHNCTHDIIVLDITNECVDLGEWFDIPLRYRDISYKLDKWETVLERTNLGEKIHKAQLYLTKVTTETSVYINRFVTIDENDTETTIVDYINRGALERPSDIGMAIKVLLKFQKQKSEQIYEELRKEYEKDFKVLKELKEIINNVV